MKQILSKLIIMIVMFSCMKKKYSMLEKTWMPIASITEAGDSSFVDFQFILTFKKDSINIIAFGKDTDSNVPYSINDDSTFNSEPLGFEKVVELNDSALKIKLNGETVIFKPLNEIENYYSERQIRSLLKGGEWTFNGPGFENRIYSFDSMSREKNLLRKGVKNVFSLDRFDIYNDQLYQEFGFWTVKNINGQMLLNIETVYGINDYKILQIETIKENKIFCKGWNIGHEVTIVLSHLPKLTGEKLTSFKRKLIKAKWFISDFVIPDEPNGSSHSTKDYYQTIDTTQLISLGDFHSKTIAYIFNEDNTYYRFKGNTKTYSGDWNILANGKILRLNEVRHGENDGHKYERFLHIKKLTENEFCITSKEYLYKEFGAYDIYYIDQKYTKRR